MFSTIKRALISVSDKSGLAEFADHLFRAGIEIVSTGGTSDYLTGRSIPVTPVSSVTGFPEILDGRVKTLHPLIHGAILGDRENPDHLDQMNQHRICPFQLVVVNLYPFRETVLNHPDEPSIIIENIDIGGPCLIRAAAKNHKNIVIITDPSDYPFIAEHIVSGSPITDADRHRFACKAFRYTSHYDHLIGTWLNSAEQFSPDLPDQLHLILEKTGTLRYGENPHQQAAIYRTPFSDERGLIAFQQLGGKEISFNNLLDTQSAWNLVTSFNRPGAVVVKHQNPCGASVSNTLADAFQRALSCDPVSAFGGIVALNRPVDPDTARRLNDAHFLEVIAAPDFDMDSLTLLKKKKNRRLVRLTESIGDDQPLDVRLLHNGALIQTTDRSPDNRESFKTVTKVHPTESEWADLLFGWTVCRAVKSNAIVCARDTRAIGVGAGQMSRVDSVAIALTKAGDSARGGILASDAFFPFSDSVDLAARAGIKALIQPGGSKGDPEVIAACDTHGIAMVFTGIRHFKH
ncbi:bifunctional phosphoribosylaminoimidazolecarboxamide formyltransferase/IMP cyclohydrolase [bacterium]|nr:bifunctional phosphoribosylaminoimidazolecarboxamide formyltransferase/IMP cyclohydrolase [candidate division CSSED10-310 bacterium]